MRIATIMLIAVLLSCCAQIHNTYYVQGDNNTFKGITDTVNKATEIPVTGSGYGDVQGGEK